MSVADEKARLRTVIRARRRARSATARAEAAEAIAHAVGTVLPHPSGTVAVYLSLPTEPGTDPLIAALRGTGHRVLAPRIADAGLEWVVLVDDGAAVVPGPMGIREPVGPAVAGDALAAADLVLLPGLAVDRRGRRLGQGGGYYDRALADVPDHAGGGPVRAVVVFDDELVDLVPVEPHDCRVDAALTPSGLHRLR